MNRMMKNAYLGPSCLVEISIKEQFSEFVPLCLFWISIKEHVPFCLFLMFLYAYLVPLCLSEK